MHKDFERAQFLEDLWELADDASGHDSRVAMERLQTNVIFLGELETEMDEETSGDKQKERLEERSLNAQNALQEIKSATTVLRSVYSFGHADTFSRLTEVDDRSQKT